MPYNLRSESWIDLPRQMDQPIRQKLEVARLAGASSTPTRAVPVRVAECPSTSAARSSARSASRMVAGRACRKITIRRNGPARIVCLSTWKARNRTLAKHRDKSKSPLATDSVYSHDEGTEQRHARRQATAVHKGRKRLEDYCKAKGFSFDVTNEGLHWQIRHGLILIEWWPITAKMVVNKQWTKGIHVHDVRQLKHYLDFIKLLGV